jgi:hypothetical protein
MLNFAEWLMDEAVHNRNYEGTDYTNRWSNDKESSKKVFNINGYDIYLFQ